MVVRGVHHRQLDYVAAKIVNVEDAKEVVEKHGNKVFNLASAGLFGWMFATFATNVKLDREIDRERGCCEKATAQRWMDSMSMFEVKGRIASTIEVGTNGLQIAAAPEKVAP